MRRRKNLDTHEDLEKEKYEDPLPDLNGVLLSDAIKDYIDKINLIEKETFSEDNLQAASYDLRLGAEYYLNGEYYWLTEDKPDLRIPAYSVVGITTYERLHLPYYIIGRWNMRVGLVYKGLLWAGGPQVDPGFEGRLMCPVYNLSTREVVLKYKEHIVTIDFVKTTPFNPCKSKPFKQTKPLERLSDRIRELLKSGPAETLKKVNTMSEKVKEIEKEVKDMNRHMSTIMGILIGVLGVIVAVLAALFGAFNIHGFP